MAIVCLLAVGAAGAEQAPADTPPRRGFGFEIQPVAVKSSGGAVVHYQLNRRAKRSAVFVAGVRARVRQTGGATSTVYDALVTDRSLWSGRRVRVRLRIVSRRGEVIRRDERLFLHRRWPGPRALQTTRISLARQVVDGSGERVRGRVLVQTPVWLLRRTNRDASPTARFAATLGGACTATIAVSSRAAATREGPTALVRASTAFADAVLGGGERTDGAWRLVAFRHTDPDTGVQTRPETLYGIAAVTLAPRRSFQVRVVRVFADFSQACTETQRRAGPVAAALRSLLRTARVQARLAG